jgi:hypothetical protein
MTTADDINRLLQSTRAILPAMGMRPNAVSRVVRTWTSGKVKVPWPAVVDVDYEDDTLVFEPTPKVREISTREIASSGGVYADGDLRIERITPAFPSPSAGGYTPTQIAPTASGPGIEIFYVITGPLAGVYRRVDCRNDRALEYWVTVRRLRDTP